MGRRSFFIVSSLAVLDLSLAQTRCIPLQGTTACPGFNNTYITTNANVTGLFPFLANVTNTTTFDQEITRYVHGAWAQTQYVNRFGCTNFTAGNTTDYYARYSLSYLCNAVIQNSAAACLVDPTPLCVDACGEFARSEQAVVSSAQLCGTPGDNALNQLRADYEQCSQPADAISTVCIEGYENEPDLCGYQNNLAGFCNFCNTTSTVNSTDSCCVTGRAESRCANVTLPTFGQNMQPLFPTTTAAPPVATNTQVASTSGSGSGLSGGAIAGIVVGSVVGAALLLGIVIAFCIFTRRRRSGSSNNSLAAGGSTGAATGTEKTSSAPAAFEPLPGSRVTRMTALDGSGAATPPRSYAGAAAAAAGGAGLGAAAAAHHEKDSSDDESSPEYSSPEAAGHSSSERMSSFKDYYSSDDIHPNDQVAVLWAYEPRAGDEFQLERGEMLRIVGIWDDGWATGVRVPGRAEEWEASQDHAASGDQTSPGQGDVKAFPLVCVCLPKHWKKTVDGEDGEPGPSDGAFE